jgi:hypothetical protein
MHSSLQCASDRRAYHNNRNLFVTLLLIHHPPRQLVGTFGHPWRRFVHRSAPLPGSVWQACYRAHNQRCDASPSPMYHESAPSQNETHGSSTRARTMQRRVVTPELICSASPAFPWHGLCSETGRVGGPLICAPGQQERWECSSTYCSRRAERGASHGEETRHSSYDPRYCQ